MPNIFNEMKPTIFIGSSSEGLEIARALEAKLNHIGQVDLWPNIFELNASNFDNLTSQLAFYDFAVLVATADDTSVSRKKQFKSPRDNVIFEFGLFTGGLGKSRVFLLPQKDAKIPSDLFGITLPFIPATNSEGFEHKLNTVADKIINHIKNKENTSDLGFLPSTALAYGYFVNFVERTVERLLEDQAERKEFFLQDKTRFYINTLKMTILIPNDLSDDMFKKVSAKRLRDGWQKMKVEPKHIRDYDFSIDISKVTNGELHLIDIPLTLNALNKSIELYSKKEHLGKSVKENLLEHREIRSFTRTLKYLINKSSITKGIVNVEVVDI